MGADNYTSGRYAEDLVKDLKSANRSVAQRNAEITRLKAKISALESELRVRKTREKERR